MATGAFGNGFVCHYGPSDRERSMAALVYLQATIAEWFGSPKGQEWRQEQGATVLCDLCKGWNPSEWERCGWCGKGQSEVIPSWAV